MLYIVKVNRKCYIYKVISTYVHTHYVMVICNDTLALVVVLSTSWVRKVRFQSYMLVIVTSPTVRPLDVVDGIDPLVVESYRCLCV